MLSCKCVQLDVRDPSSQWSLKSSSGVVLPNFVSLHPVHLIGDKKKIRSADIPEAELHIRAKLPGSEFYEYKFSASMTIKSHLEWVGQTRQLLKLSHHQLQRRIKFSLNLYLMLSVKMIIPLLNRLRHSGGSSLLTMIIRASWASETEEFGLFILLFFLGFLSKNVLETLWP